MGKLRRKPLSTKKNTKAHICKKKKVLMTPKASGKIFHRRTRQKLNFLKGLSSVTENHQQRSSAKKRNQSFSYFLTFWRYLVVADFHAFLSWATRVLVAVLYMYYSAFWQLQTIIQDHLPSLFATIWRLLPSLNNIQMSSL